ncbi:hypothetical protein MMK62_004197 [Pseudomonas aeruginosa]|jgi:hypothetical protein|uniref:hypothetical protein n=1 Tax=Pseudomonas aeruginosa TaxID=287 RepID=UPI001F04A0C1|nr:hypothetical protein [Pseudomonas aeruginosa]EIU4992585.1 hypothetical protein [Pseudomonas aeruginosa]EIY2609118.1 hypothetical protein [Pseudomonas aeruginosa]EIY2740976.1 hypothetical protein [Pseudomonas aeruginosa]EKM0200579.1 hypothetical protein [Pseudomonas aeruginosa]EKM0220119.1 hypothetical protein [Pseudomonas aeruginosa]
MSLTGNQKAFARYLADLWGRPEALGEMRGLFPVGDASEAGLLHSFRISKHQSWKPWKGRIASAVHHWWCHSLQEAFLHYSWPDSPKPNSFQCIAARLRQALAVHDQATARDACLAIFRWGGVRGRKSLAWVEDQYQQKTLCQSIMQAVQLLQPGSAQGLAAFDGKKLLMNSAMTKVYAAADPDHIIIYDGRVGAALGLLARHSLMRAGVPSVPADLSFRWGAGQGDATNRDPSLGAFKFRKLNAAQCQLWAGQVLLAGELLQQVMAYNPSIGSIAELEKALFMIGYNVDTDLPPLPLPRVSP